MRRAAAILLSLALAAAATTTAAAAVAKAPVPPPPPPPPPNVTAEMAKGGCKAFAGLIAASPDASSTYQSAVEGGMTVFCPSDDAVRAFLPKYRNLSADGKAELLLFHAVPVHYSLGSLKSNNGPMNTLATDGAARNFNFTVQNRGDVVTIATAASAPARVKSTALDEDPLAIYVISAVVEPVELFKPAPAPVPAPAPAPASVADAPRPGKAAAGRRHPPPAAADAPGPAAEDNAAPVDQKDAKKSAAAGAPCALWWLAAALAAASALA
ncbi:fasciclin-like arabinogalactan protein 8 precursor [Zea mays]|jgi:hypothetical protein|uniref:Fasciclin-like arabinogalactan protein 8 n=1 Tax=Zea mays TaxID=4577 RepID=A0A1D6I6L8_MAIZE|nr:fasciclin-like arabinogalactan protein 8 precursor [Zea mays]ONM55714.1 Fasciclin-like arabinogalactan protein 8 [Zea mays]